MIHLPKHPYEWVLFGVFWLGGLFTVYYELILVLSYYHQLWNNMAVLHAGLTAFLAWSIYASMYLLISTDISVKQISDHLVSVPNDSRFCKRCQLSMPPRSHHCKLCDICILKRDHHCYFAGYCVGYHNHRYFICLALYMSIAGVYANIYNWEFVMGVKGGFTWTTLPSLIAPHVGLVLGYYTLYEFFITIVTSAGFLFTVLFLWLLYTQLKQIICGQVMHERRKGIHEYNLGVRNTLNEIFGSSGLLVLLCPFIPTTLPGDGSCFPTWEKEKTL